MATTHPQAGAELSPAERLNRSIEILRHSAGMSQGALGEVLAPAFGGRPLSQVAVGRRLSGAIAWRTDELELIADHFGVEVSDLWHPDRVALIRGLHSVRLAPGQMQMSFEERTPPLAAAS